MTIDPARPLPESTATPIPDGGLQLSDALQDEIVRQAQKMEAIGLFVAGVAHELNNPLAAIVGFSHLIRTDPDLPADLRHQADLLVEEANRTRVIVQNLLDFARQSPPERIETTSGPSWTASSPSSPSSSRATACRSRSTSRPTCPGSRSIAPRSSRSSST